MPDKVIVFLSCVKSKKDYECEAQELYSASTLFNKAIKYAKTLNADKIYILSAKYGLVELNDVIAPYDKTLLKMKVAEKKEWATMVKNQLESKGITFNEKAIFLCGEVYRKYVANNFKEAEFPLEGLPIGKQLQFYNNHL